MARVYKETATNVDCIEFNGKKYRRYPDSPRPHLRRYYACCGKGGPFLLHRDIWAFHNGVIPEKHHVHHRDGDHLNNDIHNLECVSRRQHDKLHHVQRSTYARSDKQREHLASIRGQTKAWHASPEGLAWHSEHSKRSWESRANRALVCAECSAPFESTFSDARFCSRSCGNKNWRRAHPEYEAQKRARAKARRLQPDS